MIITISGTPGSGKSTVAKKLVEELQAQRVYVGGIFREIAREKGMPVEDIVEKAETDTKLDISVDERARDKARQLSEKQNVIVEGRTQFHFLPESLKIYIKVSHEEGAKRIFNELQQKEAKDQRNEREVHSLEETKAKIIRRETRDVERYKKLYKVDITNESNYNFVLDTTNITANEATQKVLDFIKSKQ